jgi:opacity protein-like surface antigen
MMRFTLIATTVLLFMTAAPTAYAAGTAERIARFSNNGAFLDVTTYIDPQYAEGKARCGLITAQQDKRRSAAFYVVEWDDLIALFEKARNVHSNSWQFVGTYKEKDTTDPTLVTVSGGPGVQFTLQESDGTSTFVLLSGDYDRFASSLQTVKAFLLKK